MDKRVFILVISLCYGMAVSAQPVIADHTIVDDYDIIPQQYIDSVKKMWVTVPGESHAAGYRRGMTFVEQIDARFQVNVIGGGTPEGPTDQYLRFSAATWNCVDNNSGWIYNYGEEDWYTSDLAVSVTKAGIDYANQNNLKLSATGFGWCYDMSWINMPGGTIDPVYQVRWGGTSNGGPDGNLRWGLDKDDSILTGNRVSMDTYLAATEEYIAHCESNGYSTIVFFTTGPVDEYESGMNTGEAGYQRYLKTEYIRDHLNSRGSGYLFDYSDILCWNDDGESNTVTWTDYGGTLQEYEFIHPDNMLDLDGGYTEDWDHIGEVGTVRLGKAMWWMLARMAGWDGYPEGSDHENPSVPENLAASVVNDSTIHLIWDASTDNFGVTGYNIYRDDELISTVSVLGYDDTHLLADVTYEYGISAFDAAGNYSAKSDTVLVNINDTLGIVRMQHTFTPGFNWFSINVVNENMSLESILQSINTTGVYLKNQVASATYYDGYGWFGTLDQLDPKELYIMHVTEDCSLDYRGTLVDPADSSINIYEGWNWISYLPATSMTVSEALTSLDIVDLDYIKDISSSSTYYEGTGWYGNLTDLQPGMGYKIKVSNPGVLTYPSGSGSGKKGAFLNTGKNFNEDYLDVHDYEFTGSITAEIQVDGVTVGSEEDLLLAYVGEECRGATRGIYFTPGNMVLFPIMLYSNNDEGDQVSFKYFDTSQETYYDLQEKVEFTADMILADALNTYQLNSNSNNSNIKDGWMDKKVEIYPNPFQNEIIVCIDQVQGEPLSIFITDLSGRLVREYNKPVNNVDEVQVRIQADDIASGIYMMKIKVGSEEAIKELIKF